MSVRVIAVGKLKDSWQRGAVDEYVKRLSRYMPLEIVEVKDLPEPDKPSEALQKKVLLQEGQSILQKIKERDFAIALAIRADAPDSIAFAEKLASWFLKGRDIVFVIGGSLGLSEAVLARADARISLSNMTLPHALARVVLLEQLYRAARINANERYHK